MRALRASSVSEIAERIHAANAMVSIYDLIEEVSSQTEPRQIHCPIHTDARKSARVFPDSNSVYCWTCARAYDPVAIVSEQEGIGVTAACRYIEDNAGVRWVRIEERAGQDFWDLLVRAEADPEDVRAWRRQEIVAYRWAVHATVFELVPLSRIDWEGFDNAHLDGVKLRAWRDSQLTT